MSLSSRPTCSMNACRFRAGTTLITARSIHKNEGLMLGYAIRSINGGNWVKAVLWVSVLGSTSCTTARIFCCSTADWVPTARSCRTLTAIDDTVTWIINLLKYNHGPRGGHLWGSGRRPPSSVPHTAH